MSNLAGFTALQMVCGPQEEQELPACRRLQDFHVFRSFKPALACYCFTGGTEARTIYPSEICNTMPTDESWDLTFTDTLGYKGGITPGTCPAQLS
jgi:hypothetical protein